MSKSAMTAIQAQPAMATEITRSSAEPGVSNRSSAPLAAAAAMLASSPLAAQTVPFVPKGTGSPGPGEFRGGPVDFTLTSVEGEIDFDTFGCKVFKGSPNTPDWRQATQYFERKFYENDKFLLPDGKNITIWGFEDTLKSKGQNIYPSPIIRVTEGDMVHVKLTQGKGTHTIHHHGIEPTTMNDGVGHVSFEVEQSYIYQWQPSQAGTWFYHCHKNTVLHFEYGMFGLLVVDPPKRSDGRIPAFKDGPVYDVEAFWVADDMDPRWHTLHQEAGLCGEDAGLNIFKPRYFFVSGVPNTRTMVDPRVAVNARHGDKILIRLLNASYSVLSVFFEKFDVTVISIDGHSLNKPWNRPITYKKGERIELATATRYDIWIDTSTFGLNTTQTVVENVRFEYQDWITRKVHNETTTVPYNLGISRTTITLRPRV